MKAISCGGAVLAAIALTACTSMNPQLRPVTGDLAKTQQFYGLFDITPPQSEGWYLMQNSQGQLAYGKPKKVEKDTYVLVSTVTGTTKEFVSGEDFLEFIKIERAKDNDPQRFEMVTYSENLSKSRSEMCTDFHVKAKDKHLSNSRREIFLEMKGISCAHPSAPLVIHVFYSERSDSSFQNQDFVSDGEAFISSLVINAAPVSTARKE